MHRLLSDLKIIAALVLGAAFLYGWVRLIIWGKLKDLERREKRDAPTELHLNRKP